MDVLIAHPYKHHAFHFAAGCVRANADVCLATPLYKKGLGRFLGFLPGRVGAKARGYDCDGLASAHVYSPFRWQVARLLSDASREHVFREEYDLYVSSLLVSRVWTPRAIVTLQDYMPNVMRVANDLGIKTVSDQILNQSDVAVDRIRSHCVDSGILYADIHDESVNKKIVFNADVVTAPSKYLLDGVRGYLRDGTRCVTIPYGVDSKLFSVKRKHGLDESINVVARANSVRKGGHLLIESLRQVASKLMHFSGGKRVNFVVLGEFEPVLAERAKSLKLPEGFSLVAKNFAYRDVPELFSSASFFVMPSLSEGMSLACCEAMQAGLPLLVSRYVGVDFFEPGRMGLEVETSVEGLAFGLINMFEHFDDWSWWGGECIRAVSGCTWLDYEEKVGHLITSILG